MYRVFGYGSLLNSDSLNQTIGDSVQLIPAKLYGYYRYFEAECSGRVNKYNQTVSALNLKEHDQGFINGVYFYVNQNQFNNLCLREKTYDCERYEIEDSVNKTRVLAYVFIDRTQRQFPFYFDDYNQNEYLNICLNGAKSFGDIFYDEFLNTTFIGSKSLSDLKYRFNSI